MEKMRLYTHEEIEDMYIGPKGTPERDEYERQLAEEMEAYQKSKPLRRAKPLRGSAQVGRVV